MLYKAQDVPIIPPAELSLPRMLRRPIDPVGRLLLSRVTRHPVTVPEVLIHRLASTPAQDLPGN